MTSSYVPATTSTPLPAGHSYLIAIPKLDVDNGSQADPAAPYDYVDGIVTGGVVAPDLGLDPNGGGTLPSAGAKTVATDLTDNGSEWLVTLTPDSTTAIGGSQVMFPSIHYEVVTIDPASKGNMLIRAWELVKAHPVLAAVGLGAAIFALSKRARAMHRNPERRINAIRRRLRAAF